MLKRLRRLLFGQPPAAAKDLCFYPMVGSSTANGQDDATAFWPGDGALENGLDRTIMAPAPTASMSTSCAEPKGERQRIAWPARDASRSPTPAEPDAWRAAVSSRPPEDRTVLVAQRRRPTHNAG